MFTSERMTGCIIWRVWNNIYTFFSCWKCCNRLGTWKCTDYDKKTGSFGTRIYSRMFKGLIDVSVHFGTFRELGGAFRATAVWLVKKTDFSVVWASAAWGRGDILRCDLLKSSFIYHMCCARQFAVPGFGLSGEPSQILNWKRVFSVFKWGHLRRNLWSWVVI
jgi:hypothetical protein